MPIPRLYPITQHFTRRALDDLHVALDAQLRTIPSQKLRDASIAVAVGSRGIAHIADITAQTVTFLKNNGANPFVFPAMGSHGGATAQGQREVLTSLGITEAALGCPVRASMEVEEIDAPGLPHKVFVDAYAWNADHILMINRIKPHTAYYGDYESGLVKMACIGVGKHAMAQQMHRCGVQGLRDMMPDAAAHLFATGKFLGGIALVEDAYDEIMHVEYLDTSDTRGILAREPDLLRMAVDNMPRLPVEDIDILIVDETGKNISGTGMDTKIVGRMRLFGVQEPVSPRVNQIVACDLTPETHGNAVGVGLADVITRRLYEKIDFQKTYENVRTSTFLSRAFIPVVADTQDDAFDWAAAAAGAHKKDALRVVRIRNTLQLDNVGVSEAVYREMK